MSLAPNTTRRDKKDSSHTAAKQEEACEKGYPCEVFGEEQ